MSQSNAVSQGQARGTERKAGRSFPRRLKARLQFTGWLQYLITAVTAVAFFLLAAVGWAVGFVPVVLFWLPAGLGSVLLVALTFDLVTVKAGLLPSEALPGRKDELGVFDLMRSRRSCRSFQSRPLTPSHRSELVEHVRVHSQLERLIGSSRVRLEYVAAPLTVWPVVGAREFLVAIAPREYDRLAVIDVGRILEKVVLDATRMGLATCWIGPGADQKSIARHLGDRFSPEHDHVICVCAVGYASRYMPLPIRFMELLQHRRLPLTSLFFADPYFRQPLDVNAPPFASFGRCYEVCEWSPSSYNGQTTRCAAVVERVEEEDRLERFDFCASTTSRYYAAVAVGIWCANWETGCQALGIRGHFAVLTPEARRVQDAPELPRYDVSWVPASPASAS